MTTIFDLPLEVLFKVFRDLTPRTLYECQQVCKEWYTAAHTTFLKEIRIDSFEHMLEFLEAIDSNPAQAYLNAVKIIKVNNLDTLFNWRPEREVPREPLSRLLLSFPQVQEIHLINSHMFLEPIGQQLSDMLPELCPQLEKLSVCPVDDYVTTSSYYDLLYTLRHIVSSFCIDSTFFPMHLDSIAYRYIYSFPQLQKYSDLSGRPKAITFCLPLLKRLPRISELQLVAGEDEKLSLVEKYISESREEDAEYVLQRLSSITKFHWTYRDGHCTNTLMIISKYLTGLDELRITGMFPSSLRKVQSCCDSVSNLIQNVRHSYFNVTMQKFVVKEYLPVLVDALRHKTIVGATPKNAPGINLELCVRPLDDIPKSLALMEVSSHKSRYRQQDVLIEIDDEMPFDDMIERLFMEGAPLNGVTKFEFSLGDIRDSPYDNRLNVRLYERLLRRFPSLERLVLHVDSRFDDISKQGTASRTFPLVRHLSLLVGSNVGMQNMLNRFYFTFPNIERLDLHYFCGVWEVETGVGEIDLSRYSLKKLAVDMNFLWSWMMKILPKKRLASTDFCVIDLGILSSNEQFLYKSPLHNVSLATEINRNDLNGFVCGKDYICLKITVDSLSSLELLMYKANAHMFELALQVPQFAMEDCTEGTMTFDRDGSELYKATFQYQ